MDTAKILVVEDNPLNMELVCDILEANGYAVYQASAAQEGIKIARESIPHLILMDIQLPGMDGLAATQILKDDTTTKDIPVVALTAHAMKGDEQKALEAGCSGYITKPIDTREFPKLVKTFFDSSALQ
jgi:two-component system, cell cycle response regulator DivK